MILVILIAALSAETVEVSISAARQASVSDMKAMKRLKLGVYGVSVCAPEAVTVPVGRVTAALATRGVPVEFPDFLPLVFLRGTQESVLGRIRTGGEALTGLGSIGLAAAKADWRITAGVGAVSFLLGMVKRRQDDVVQILLPLAAKLLRPAEQVVPSSGACHSGLVLSAGDVPVVETTIFVRVPDAPIRTAAAYGISDTARWPPRKGAE